MSSQAYVGTAKRTFKQALIRLLETDYGLLGSRRVLSLLAEDVERLVNEFYPAPQRLSGGWMVFTGTKASGKKSRPGQSASDYELRTLAWPVVLPEDVQQLASSGEGKQSRQKWFQQRLVRVLEHGWDHPDGPVLLTLADLSAMTGLGTVQVSQLLQQAREETGKSLLTKGYYFDQGMRPTHKKEIVALYEQGMDEADIAQRSGHAPQSVGRYLRDYDRIKMMIQQGISLDRAGRLLGMQPNVVRAYAEIVERYHPDLKPQAEPSSEHN